MYMHISPHTDTDPVSKEEVDSLGTVEALVEAGMVGPRERHHKLSLTLVCANHLPDTHTHHGEKISSTALTKSIILHVYTYCINDVHVYICIHMYMCIQ